MPIHALVVDDDPLTRGVVAEQLLKLNAASVRSASCGRRALEIVRQDRRVNLLITDLRMPDLDGIALLAALDQFRKQLHVIIMSALGDKILNAASRIGVGHNLSVVGVSGKPLSLKSLDAMLQPVRQHPRPHQAVAKDGPGIVIDDIRSALLGDEYHIVVQPEVRASDLELEAVEVLSRWSHPQLSRRSPADVITAAEGAGIIGELNEQMLHKVGIAWRGWSRDKLSPRISINISALSMSNTGFPDWLSQRIAPLGLDPGDLILELTETALPAAGTDNLEVACRLGMLGFQLSVDDFGTGFANLQQLQDLPFAWLKIDRCFVQQMERCEDARTIIKSSIRMAHDLGLTTVGEGVENALQQRMLRDLGCDLLQGYHIARPMPPEALADWYQHFRQHHQQVA